MTTAKSFKRIATQASAAVVHGPDDWVSATHPDTGNILQLNPYDGGVTVHCNHGSWSTGPNDLTTITAIWKGTFR